MRHLCLKVEAHQPGGLFHFPGISRINGLALQKQAKALKRLYRHDQDAFQLGQVLRVCSVSQLE